MYNNKKQSYISFRHCYQLAADNLLFFCIYNMLYKHEHIFRVSIFCRGSQGK